MTTVRYRFWISSFYSLLLRVSLQVSKEVVAVCLKNNFFPSFFEVRNDIVFIEYRLKIKLFLILYIQFSTILLKCKIAPMTIKRPLAIKAFAVLQIECTH